MAIGMGARPGVQPLLLGLLAVGALVFVLAPWSFLDKLEALSAGVCRQRPDHSYFLGGAQLPLEARMGGIFAGFLAAMVWLWGTGRERAALLPPRSLQALLFAFIAWMCLDGTNALLYDTGGPALYHPPQNWLRLVTGLLCGVGLALLALPVLASVLWRQTDAEPSVGSLAELAGPLCIVALVQAATMSGLGWLLYPVASFTVAGLIASFAVGNAYAAVLIGRAERGANSWRQALNPLLAGVLITLVELAALAWLRYWSETTLGIQWPV